MMPIVLPSIIIGVGLFYLYAKLGMLHTSAGLILGHTVFALPYVVVTTMAVLRTYDERSLVFHRQGRIGTYAIFWGAEAMQAGAVHALERRDWIFPSYRESAIGLLRGIPASTVLSWWRGHPSGWWNPADYNVASICVPIGTQVPHAAGLAWGKKLNGEDAVAIVFFGDGATSEGSFH